MTPHVIGRFAGRYALGKNLPAVDTKTGFSFNRVGSGEVRVLGGACSEVLGGANLAALLRDGWELEQRAMSSLARSEPAEVLSIHTSAGVPPQLETFINALEPHLPVTGGDWCVNLQAEGAKKVDEVERAKYCESVQVDPPPRLGGGGCGGHRR